MIKVRDEDLVSVILPTYNSEKTIDKTLTSILSQDYQNLEILVIDDKSSDNTRQIIENFALKDQRIKLFKKPENKGVADSRNLGIKKATGKYVAFLDSDDLWPRNKIKDQVKFMQKHKALFTYSDYKMYDVKENKFVGLQKTPKRISYYSALLGNVVGCSSVMFNKEVIGPVQIPNLEKRNDAALWLKILKKARYGFQVPNITFQYNIRHGSLSSGKKSDLLKHHYIMYRKSQGYNPILSITLTLINVLKFVYKKIFYFEKIT